MDRERIAKEAECDIDTVHRVLAAVDRQQAELAQSSQPQTTNQHLKLATVASWAAAIVVIISVYVFAALTDGLNDDSHGKGGLLIVSTLVVIGSVIAARAANRQGITIGTQLGWTIAALQTPLILWSLAWLIGIWPQQPYGDTWPDRPDISRIDAYDSARWWSIAGISLITAAAQSIVAWRWRSPLALFLAIASIHIIIGAGATAADVNVDNSVLLMLGSILFSVIFVIGASWCEDRWTTAAGWIWTYALGWSTTTVFIIGDLTDDTVAWLVALVVSVGYVLIGGLVHRIHVVVTGVIGLIALDIAAHSVFNVAPLVVLVVGLIVGLGAIVFAATLWHRAPTIIPHLPPSLQRVTVRARRLNQDTSTD